MMRRHLLSILLLLLTALSCREPASMEQFIRGEGPYVFTVDMAEGRAYSFDLYTRIDASEAEMAPLVDLPLRVEWRSPSDSVFRETVYLPLSGTDRFFSRTVYHPYRKGMVPREPGRWTLRFTAPAVIPHRGLGLVVRHDVNQE
jgi:hypothetical protein